jgi:hypothetical protein
VDVIKKDAAELVLVLGLEQIINRAGGELGEGFIGWSKDRKGAGAEWH